MKFKLVEDNNQLSLGDVFTINNKAFKKYPGKFLTRSGHLFIVVKEDPLTVVNVSSDEKNAGEDHPYSITIEDWQKAGFRKPCYARVETSGIISNSDIFTKIGSLSEEDRNRIIAAYNNAPQLQILEELDYFS